jgi:hypothetical protein
MPDFPKDNMSDAKIYKQLVKHRKAMAAYFQKLATQILEGRKHVEIKLDTCYEYTPENSYRDLVTGKFVSVPRALLGKQTIITITEGI